MPGARRGALAAVDALAVVVFAAVGRSSHASDGGLVGLAGTAAPFLAGALVGALVARSWRDPLSWRAGLLVWAGAVVLGLALRGATTGSLPPSFVLVTTVALAVLVLGWRAVARAVLAAMRGRARATTGRARRGGPGRG